MTGPDGARLWSIVAATVRPLPGRSAPSGPAPGRLLPAKPPRSTKPGTPIAAPPEPPSYPGGGPSKSPVSAARPIESIEPNRHRRLTRSREAAPAILDLHGLDQARARAALTSFILRAHGAGERAVLIITGKGALGDGVLRRRTPDWLAEPPLRPMVAGLSEAHRRHGGEGAIYVALKRRGS